MSLYFHILFIGFAIFLTRYSFADRSHAWWYYGGVSVKVLSGILIGYFYLVYLGNGDIVFYFNSAVSLLDQTDGTFGTLWTIFTGDIPVDEWQSRSEFFIRVVAPIVWLSGKNFWLTGIYLSVFTFIHIWLLITTLAEAFPSDKKLFLLVFLFFPSAFFWTSGISKDALVFASVATIMTVFIRAFFVDKVNEVSLIYALLMLLILIKIKFFVAVLLMASMAIFIVDRFLYKSYKKWMLFSFLLVAVVISMQFLHPWMRLTRLPLTIFELNQQIRIAGNPVNEIAGLGVSPNYFSMAFYTFPALFTGLFRPLPWENFTFWSIFVKLENLLLIYFTAITVFNWRQIHLNPAIKSLLFFVIVLSVFITLTTPNYGTLFRYRSVYIPFFLLLISIIPFRLYFPKKPDSD